MLSTIGQILSAPFTSTLPVLGCSLQVTATLTAVVWLAVTLKVPEPPQEVEASVLVAESVIT